MLNVIKKTLSTSTNTSRIPTRQNSSFEQIRAWIVKYSDYKSDWNEELDIEFVNSFEKYDDIFQNKKEKQNLQIQDHSSDTSNLSIIFSNNELTLCEKIAYAKEISYNLEDFHRLLIKIENENKQIQNEEKIQKPEEKEQQEEPALASFISKSNSTSNRNIQTYKKRNSLTKTNIDVNTLLITSTSIVKSLSVSDSLDKYEEQW